jgi:hypothetical protein
MALSRHADCLSSPLTTIARSRVGGGSNRPPRRAAYAEIGELDGYRALLDEQSVSSPDYSTRL